MERREPEDDDLYPLAPLPAHERMWRHPSEVGAATWANTEPPFVLGRGLAVAVSMIGGLLTITVLWAMLSTNPGTSSSVTVASAGERSGLLNWVFPKAPAQGIRSAVPAAAPSSAATARAATATTPESAHVVAVNVGKGTLALTIAASVAGRSKVDIDRPDGSSVVASVLFHDLDGIAVLRVETPASVAGLELGPRPAVGDQVRIGDAETTTIVDQREGGTLQLSSPCPAQGTPVIDLDGRLIGLCSRSNDGEAIAVEVVRILQHTLAELTP